MIIAITSISLLFFLCLALSFNVSISRSITGKATGIEKDETNLLFRVQRAHSLSRISFLYTY